MTVNLVAVKCKLHQGIFPSECYFEITLANGEMHKGIAPRHFCWNSLARIIEEEEDPNGADGYVAAKLLSSNLPQDFLAVEVPDGEVVAVRRDLVVRRPTKITPPGPQEELELPEVCI